MADAVPIAYSLVLAALTLLCLHRLQLVLLLATRRGEEPAVAVPGEWPPVCVQLPLYDEANVAARVIDAVAALDYPRDRLEVQVLDDSSDETSALCAERVAWHRARGLAITHVRRGSREGFKAGALEHGLARTRAPLIAVFDADFVPGRDFLRRTVPHLVADPGVGLVQARWEHLDRDAHLLARLQALALDAHFRVEQRARGLSGRFFNFNGTAGVFRRAAIEAAGGWSADTVTEDLDLSLRAQLCGWRFVYLDAVAAPAELPGGLAALRAQQERWTRGAGQTARKLLPAVWRAPDVALRARLEASFQLLLGAAHPLLLLLALLATPLAALGTTGPLLVALQWTLCGAAIGSIAAFYAASQTHRGPRAVAAALLATPALFALGFGLCLSNALAYARGLRGHATAFVRTPKTGTKAVLCYPAARASVLPWCELALGLYALLGVALALASGRSLAAPPLLLVAVGFVAVGASTLPRPRARASAAARPIAATPPLALNLRHQQA